MENIEVSNKFWLRKDKMVPSDTSTTICEIGGGIKAGNVDIMQKRRAYNHKKE